jgi:Fe-S oxidoreductase
MLKIAKRLARRNLDLLGPLLSAGKSIVGIEPSCIAAFREETGNLYPNDEDARRLAAQTYTLAELLQRDGNGFDAPPVRSPVIVQGHCHHKAIMGLDAEQKLYESMGIDWGDQDWGCCGMAGSFGYEREKYDVSMRIGERFLLPAVREQPDATVVADGFSCRSQIKHGTGRQPLHTAQLLRHAIREKEA